MGLAAGVQLQGVLDELFFYEGPLGANLTQSGTEIHVWAPTAQQVLSLHDFQVGFCVVSEFCICTCVLPLLYTLHV